MTAGLMPAYYSREDARNASALRTALTSAGIDVPADLDHALNSLSWTIEVPAEPDTSALFVARTEAEYRKAADAYADALVKRDRLIAIRETAQTARLDVVSTALTSARAEAVTAAVERFDDAAEKFADAVQAFPDVDPSTMSTEDFSRFAQAREHADRMRRAYTVYTAVYGPDPTQGRPADIAWHRIAHLEDRDALVAVVESNQRHRTGALAPLAPYYSVARNGGTLRLVNPDRAEASYQAANDRQAVKDEENRPADRSHPGQANISTGTFARVAANLRPMGR